MPVVVLADPRAAMAGLAAELYDHPATRMRMLGVTGTNGKTTTAYLVDAGLRAAGLHTGLIGTLGFSFDGVALAGARTTVTTPESAELQGLLAALVQRGAEATAMEVSSHALTLGRVDAIRFDVAGFTNFGRDHLDFHGSEEAYFAAKASLFTHRRARRAVINLDDPRGAELVRQARDEGLAVSTTSLRATSLRATSPGADEQPTYRATQVRPGPAGSAVTVATPDGPLEVQVGLPGDYNVANALTALAMLAGVGVDLSAAVAGFASVAVPGRMQRVPLGTGAPAVYVDFAHTPQAVTSALAALRPAAGKGRLICVLGCGGDRDRAKRGPMGEAAARGVEPGTVIVTDDNPRTEDPAAIREAVLAGASSAIAGARLEVELVDGADRRNAIRTALAAAAASDRPDEIVLAVLGKGHEQGQQVGDQLQPFDDVAVVGEEWAALGREARR